MDTYIANLTEANVNAESKSPEYFRLYNHRENLEMENLFPSDFDELAHNLATDDPLYEKYFRYHNDNK